MSLVVGGGVAAALLHGFRKVDGIGWPMVIAAGVAVLGLLALGVDPVIRRFEDTFADPGDSFSTRASLLKDTVSMIAAFPVFGAGLGSYWVTFPAYDTTVRGGVAEHAENQYIESFAEIGALGGILGLAFVAVVLIGAWRRIRESNDRTALGLFGIAFGISALAFHSLTDFGLEIPAVGFLFACLLGATLGQSSVSTANWLAPARTPARFVLAGCSAAAAVGLATGLPSAFRSVEAFEAGRSAEELRTRDRQNTRERTHRSFTRNWLETQPSSGQRQTQPTSNTGSGRHSPRGTRSVIEKRQNLNWQTDDEERQPDRESPVTPAISSGVEDEQAEETDQCAPRERAQLGPTFGPIWSVAGQLNKIWIDDDGR